MVSLEALISEATAAQLFCVNRTLGVATFFTMPAIVLVTIFVCRILVETIIYYWFVVILVDLILFWLSLNKTHVLSTPKQSRNQAAPLCGIFN